ncbi:hypothetical protein QOT17_004996 [Balamuthia mandrillaris]
MEPELEALGRTRLRVELRRRGLSCSGLKHELQARLRDYFAGGGTVLGLASSSAPTRGQRARAPRNKKSEQPQEEAVHRAPKTQRRKRKHEPNEGEEQSKAGQKRRKKANTTGSKADNRTRKQQKKRAFTKRRTNKKNKATKKEEEKAPEDGTNEEQDVQKEVLCFTPSQSEASDDEGEEDDGSNVLDGCTFVNKVQHQRHEQQALRSVERFVFKQHSFSFIYKCWRGEEQIHNAEIHGGTFHFTSAPFTPSKPTQESPTESNSGDTETHKSTEQTKEQQATTAKAAKKKEKQNEKEEKEQQTSHGAPTWMKKVVLHWPSSALQPALKTFTFQRTYPCFYLLKISVDHAFCKEGALALRRLLAAASLPVPSTVSLSSSFSSLILVSRQNAVFIPDSSKPEQQT